MAGGKSSEVARHQHGRVRLGAPETARRAIASQGPRAARSTAGSNATLNGSLVRYNRLRIFRAHISTKSGGLDVGCWAVLTRNGITNNICASK
jgi:hypothetical protein